MTTNRIPIDVYCEKKISTIDKSTDCLIDYVDISAVDNREKKIVSFKTVEAKGAPSRARQIINKNDIIVSTVRPNLNAVAIVEKETENLMVASTGYCVLRCKENMDYRYLFNFCQSEYFVNDMSSQATGASYPAVSDRIVKSSLIPYYSIEEQRRITKEIDTVSDLITNKKEQIKELDNLVKSRFIEMMKQGDASNFLEEFITPYKAERCGERDLPVLSITKEDGIVLQNEKFKKRIASVDTTTYKMVPMGKLVQGIHIDERNFAIQNIVDVGIVSPAYKIWTVNENRAIPEVLAYAMRTDASMSYIRSKFTGSIKRRETISYEDFMAMPTNLPKIALQKEFAVFVQQTDKLKLAAQETLSELETLKKSLMQKYFG